MTIRCTCGNIEFAPEFICDFIYRRNSFLKFSFLALPDDFQTTVGGIELSEKHSEQTRMGTIITCGDQVDEYTPLRYKKGDKIFIEFHSGTKLHVLRYFIIDEKFRVVFEEEILGQLEE